MAVNTWLHRVAKSESDKWVGGVCGGLGKYTPLPSWSWRFIFSFSVLVFGIGLLPYILLWIFLPREGERDEEDKKSLPTT